VPLLNTAKKLIFRWRRQNSRAINNLYPNPMTKQYLAIVTILISSAVLHAQDSSSTSDLNKLISAAVNKGGSSSSSVVLKDPIAIVNGETISRAALEKNFNEALAANNVNPASLTADQKLQGYNQILSGMIVEKLVDKEASSIPVSDAELNAQLDKIKGQFPSEEVFKSELKKSGLTPEKFNAKLKSSIRQTKWMQQQVQGKDVVTEAEAKAFYDANLKEFTNPDLVRASHILFLVPANATPEQTSAAEAKAKAAIVRANQGEDFSKLADELSEEPGAKQRHGDIGFFPKERMVPEFADAAFAQKVGSVSVTPVKTKFGYHVIKVTDRKAAGTASFEEAKAQILQFLQAQKRRAVFKSVVQELKQSAKIQDNLPAPPPEPASGIGGPSAPGAGASAPVQQ
jgi:peptidyl-prolyl cis-trans isomerase C